MLFEDRIKNWWKKNKSKKRKVLYFFWIDNLKFICIIFLPHNTTSKLQLIDVRVIYSLKTYNKSLPLQKLT